MTGESGFYLRPVIVISEGSLGSGSDLAVIKARHMSVGRPDRRNYYDGYINDFFPLMGNIIIGPIVKGEYTLWWTDDKEDDYEKSGRVLNGVTFPRGIMAKGKFGSRNTYTAYFEAKYAELEWSPTRRSLLY